MNLASARLALVVASQTPAMPLLTGLETAARDLERALLDPAVGACRPANEDVASALGELDEQTIRTAVSDAIARAATQRATLVLAFLGHGFVAGRGLYFMHKDSVGEVRNRALSIDGVLADAFDQPGVDGVLAILDVCSAGAAVPSASDLASGVRNGRTSTTIIMASAANQPASEMRFTRSLVEVMRGGVAGHGPVLTVDVVVNELRRRVAGQDVSYATFNGDPFGAVTWLARNGQAPGAVGRPYLSAGERRPLSRDDLRMMTKLLLDIPVFSRYEDARALVLSLPAQVCEQILPAAAMFLDIPMMLRVFEDHPQLDLWQSLTDALDQEGAVPAVGRLKVEARRLGLIG